MLFLLDCFRQVACTAKCCSFNSWSQQEENTTLSSFLLEELFLQSTAHLSLLYWAFLTQIIWSETAVPRVSFFLFLSSLFVAACSEVKLGGGDLGRNSKTLNCFKNIRKQHKKLPVTGHFSSVLVTMAAWLPYQVLPCCLENTTVFKHTFTQHIYITDNIFWAAAVIIKTVLHSSQVSSSRLLKVF